MTNYDQDCVSRWMKANHDEYKSKGKSEAQIKAIAIRKCKNNGKSLELTEELKAGLRQKITQKATVLKPTIAQANRVIGNPRTTEETKARWRAIRARLMKEKAKRGLAERAKTKITGGREKQERKYREQKKKTIKLIQKKKKAQKLQKEIASLMKQFKEGGSKDPSLALQIKRKKRQLKKLDFSEEDETKLKEERGKIEERIKARRKGRKKIKEGVLKDLQEKKKKLEAKMEEAEKKADKEWERVQKTKAFAHLNEKGKKKLKKDVYKEVNDINSVIGQVRSDIDEARKTIKDKAKERLEARKKEEEKQEDQTIQQMVFETFRGSKKAEQLKSPTIADALNKMETEIAENEKFIKENAGSTAKAGAVKSRIDANNKLKKRKRKITGLNAKRKVQIKKLIKLKKKIDDSRNFKDKRDAVNNYEAQLNKVENTVKQIKNLLPSKKGEDKEEDKQESEQSPRSNEEYNVQDMSSLTRRIQVARRIADGQLDASNFTPSARKKILGSLNRLAITGAQAKTVRRKLKEKSLESNLELVAKNLEDFKQSFQSPEEIIRKNLDTVQSMLYPPQPDPIEVAMKSIEANLEKLKKKNS